MRERSVGCILVYLRDEDTLREIKHAARLSGEIEGWQETDHSEWGEKRGKSQSCSN